MTVHLNASESFLYIVKHKSDIKKSEFYESIRGNQRNRVEYCHKIINQFSYKRHMACKMTCMYFASLLN